MSITPSGVTSGVVVPVLSGMVLETPEFECVGVLTELADACDVCEVDPELCDECAEWSGRELWLTCAGSDECEAWLL